MLNYKDNMTFEKGVFFPKKLIFITLQEWKENASFNFGKNEKSKP